MGFILSWVVAVLEGAWTWDIWFERGSIREVSKLVEGGLLLGFGWLLLGDSTLGLFPS